MTSPKTYIVEFRPILAVADRRTRGVLAMKALAAWHGLRSSRGLSRYGVTSGELAEAVIGNIVSASPGFSMGMGDEPAHPSDRCGSPVSLEEFCLETERRETDALERCMDAVDAFVAEDDWMRASFAATRALSEIHGYNRSAVIGYLRLLSDHDSRARLAYARALMEGDSVPADPETAKALLWDTVGDDDADVAGYAHLLLGNALRDVPGRAREAMRHYESAGNLGYELGAEEAGVMLQHGCDGLPPDAERAARNFRTGAALGSSDCMVRLSVMILAGDIAYSPQWRRHYERALELDDRNALDMYPLVLQARASSRDDPEQLVSHFSGIIAGEPATAGG